MIPKFKSGDHILFTSEFSHEKLILRVISHQWDDYEYVYIVSQKFPYPTQLEESKNFFKMYAKTLELYGNVINIDKLTEETFRILYGK